MTAIEQQNVNNSLAIIEELEGVLNDAERSLKSARTWGFIDTFGGGLVTDLIKHSKLNKAKSSMEYAQNLFERLSSSLGAIPFPEDLRMQVGGFMTFADFLFDGTLVDVIMLSKIFSSIERVHEFQKKISQLHTYLKKLS